MPDILSIAAGIDSPHVTRIQLRNINGKIAGPVVLEAIPAGNKVFIPFAVIGALTAAVGVTTAASISLGTNAPTFDDMMAITSLSGVAQGKYGPLPLKPVLPLLTGGLSVSLNITTAAVASGAYTLAIMILGVWA